MRTNAVEFLVLLIDYKSRNLQVLSASSFINANPDDAKSALRHKIVCEKV